MCSFKNFPLYNYQYFIYISLLWQKNLCNSLPVSTWLCSSGGSWKYDFSDIWYISDVTPSWLGEYSSKSMLMSCSNESDVFSGNYVCGCLSWFGWGPVNQISTNCFFLLISCISFLVFDLVIRSSGLRVFLHALILFLELRI